ncbi:hypothetical protein [Staphylococcus epidermidis]|nr:hypothetical protein [Staphylococcus epidermidis]
MKLKEMDELNYRLREVLRNYLDLIDSSSEGRMCDGMKKGEIDD